MSKRQYLYAFAVIIVLNGCENIHSPATPSSETVRYRDALLRFGTQHWNADNLVVVESQFEEVKVARDRALATVTPDRRQSVNFQAMEYSYRDYEAGIQFWQDGLDPSDLPEHARFEAAVLRGVKLKEESDQRREAAAHRERLNAKNPNRDRVAESLENLRALDGGQLLTDLVEAQLEFHEAKRFLASAASNEIIVKRVKARAKFDAGRRRLNLFPTDGW